MPELSKILENANRLEHKLTELLLGSSASSTPQLLRDLQGLNVEEFVRSSKNGLSAFNSSLQEDNTATFILVDKIIRQFSAIAQLIAPQAHSASFFTHKPSFTPKKLETHLKTIREILNQHQYAIENLPHQYTTLTTPKKST